MDGMEPALIGMVLALAAKERMEKNEINDTQGAQNRRGLAMCVDQRETVFAIWS
jgi:hypothetical protein